MLYYSGIYDDSDYSGSGCEDDDRLSSYTPSESSSSGSNSRVIDEDMMEHRLNGLVADASYR